MTCQGEAGQWRDSDEELRVKGSHPNNSGTNCQAKRQAYTCRSSLGAISNELGLKESHSKAGYVEKLADKQR